MTTVVALLLAATFETVSDEERSDAAKIDFGEAFRSNRLLFGELVVAMERSNRSPKTPDLQLMSLQDTNTFYHRDPKQKIPQGTVLGYKAIADLTELTTERKMTPDAVERAVEREVKRRTEIDKFWYGTLVATEKKRIAENAYWEKVAPDLAPKIPLANAQAAISAGLYGDPDRQEDYRKRSSRPAEFRKKIAHYKDLQNKILRHLAMKREETASFPPPPPLKTQETDNR